MLIKTIILLLHISTNSVLQIGIMSYTFDNNEYTIINLFVGFFAGIVILFIDFFLCRGLIMRESKNSKKTAVIHFSDLVLSFPPLVLLVYYAATAGMHGNSSAVNLDFGYKTLHHQISQPFL